MNDASTGYEIMQRSSSSIQEHNDELAPDPYSPEPTGPDESRLLWFQQSVVPGDVRTGGESGIVKNTDPTNN
jgi:hypothetical protein